MEVQEPLNLENNPWLSKSLIQNGPDFGSSSEARTRGHTEQQVRRQHRGGRQPTLHSGFLE